MSFTGILAQATVTDLERATAWYTTIFERAPDANPMDRLLEWYVGKGFGLQVWEEPGRAGQSSVVLMTDDLDAVADRLTAAGIAHDGITPATAFRTLQLEDPDGNRLVIVGD